jgi:hypothetical protein
MKISRKMRLQVEMKIRHGMATGSLPEVERQGTSTTYNRQAPEKGNGGGSDAAK